MARASTWALAAASWLALCGVAAAGPTPPPTDYGNAGSAVAGAASPMFGDSLTAGGEDGSSETVPSELSLDWGIPVVNGGIGGQVSTQICMRQGGCAIDLTFSANRILWQSLTTITQINGQAPVGMSTTQTPETRYLSTTADNQMRQNYGVVCGVHGYVQRNSPTGGPPSTGETYSFWADNAIPTSGVACPAGSAFVPDAAYWAPQSEVMWWGRNNATATAQVQADVADGVAHLGHTRYLVMSIINGDYPTEQAGQSGYNAIVTLNNDLSATYSPSGHYWDDREWLVSRYNPANPVDVLNHANDVVPYSLRAVDSNTTLAGAITDTTSCAISLTNAGVAVDFTAKIDSEYIYVTGISGNNITACVRGYGAGGTAATHSNGAAVALTDPLHLSGTSYGAVADYINANFGGLLVRPMKSVAASSQSQGATPYAPQNFNASVTIQRGDLNLTEGKIRIQASANGCFLASYYSNLSVSVQGPSCLLRFDGATESVATSLVNIFEIGSGVGGVALEVQNDGFVQYFHGLFDNSYVYSAPTTGGTVTVSDTTDFAVIDPAGSLSTLTVNLPTCNAAVGSAQRDGLIAGFSTTQAVASLTVGATAGSVANGAPTALIAGQAVNFICRGTNSTWYRR